MKAKYLFIVSMAILFVSCTHKSKDAISSFLKKEELPSQVFGIDINADTTLVTKSGCIIRLPKGTFQCDSNNVKLEIREALSTTDIVLAGLTTMSGQQPLSSGGMIYINAAQGYKIEIKKQVEILVPTKNYNPSMEVFKGEEKGNGNIDWTEPTPLPEDETIIKIANGKKIFKANCASCHKIEKDFTAPALAGVTDRRPKQWLYDFTRNPMKMISEIYQSVEIKDSSKVDSVRTEFIPDFYSPCLFHKWNNVQMTAFANLSDNELDALYSYIKTGGDKLKPYATGTDTTKKDCCDSCVAYGKAMFAAYKKYGYLLQREQEYFTLDRSVPVPVIVDTTNKPVTNTPVINIPEPTKSYVTPASVRATYYTINVKLFGWYNIDILMKDFSNCKPSELFVRLQGSYEVEANVVLVIPSVKVFVEGGKLDDGKQYGFDETNGKIPLPPGAQCYIMAFAEYKDKIIFGKSSFIAGEKQTVSVSLSETTKELLKAQVKQMDLDDVTVEVNKMPIPLTPDKNVNFDKKMEEVMKLRPRGCACGIEH